MKKQLTERQILRTWDSEYKLSIQSGFSLTEACRRAQIRADATQQNSD